MALDSESRGGAVGEDRNEHQCRDNGWRQSREEIARPHNAPDLSGVWTESRREVGTGATGSGGQLLVLNRNINLALNLPFHLLLVGMAIKIKKKIKIMIKKLED